MVIKSYVGGHGVKVFTGCTYDPAIRKYRGGRLAVEIPYSGRMLSAKVSQENAEPIFFDGVSIPVKTAQVFQSVDEIPGEDECDYCVVSAMYVAACKALGLDTSRLLTIGAPVADENGHVIGTVFLNRN